METKNCNKCLIPYELEKFQLKSNGTRYNQCVYCRRSLIKDHYQKNKDKYKARNKKTRLERVQLIKSHKQKPCADCNQQYPFWVMQFDHVRGEKLMDVSRLQRCRYSIDTILTEISKCDVVCANCHADRTYKRTQARS